MNDDEAFRILRCAGWELEPPGVWIRPMFPHVVSQLEYAALDELCNNWDYGWSQ